MKKSILYIVLLILSLPILLVVFNPSMQLGGFGLLLGFIGTFISPVVLFGVLIVQIIKSFNSNE